MRKYCNPKIEVLEFDMEDIVTSSSNALEQWQKDNDNATVYSKDLLTMNKIKVTF